MQKLYQIYQKQGNITDRMETETESCSVPAGLANERQTFPYTSEVLGCCTYPTGSESVPGLLIET